jgi:hypothetical protein
MYLNPYIETVNDDKVQHSQHRYTSHRILLLHHKEIFNPARYACKMIAHCLTTDVRQIVNIVLLRLLRIGMSFLIFVEHLV